MAYTKVGWKNGASGGTPINAANLEHMDAQILQNTNDIATLNSNTFKKFEFSLGDTAFALSFTGYAVTRSICVIILATSQSRVEAPVFVSFGGSSDYEKIDDKLPYYTTQSLNVSREAGKLIFPRIDGDWGRCTVYVSQGINVTISNI